jgi:hypothetical protein
MATKKAKKAKSNLGGAPVKKTRNQRKKAVKR